MGYRALSTAVVRAACLVRGLAPRRAWIVALVFCFAAASVVSAMAPVFAAVPVPLEAAVSHDHHAHGDAHAAHETPCDHGQDCKCHGNSAPAHCCSASTPAAAIWTTAEPLPLFAAARCADAVGRLAVRAAVDPPTPPPRSVQS